MSYNYISLGDHCASVGFIQHLGLRTSAYPFDWNIMLPMLHTSSVLYNVRLLNTLIHTHDVKAITQHYIGDALNSEVQVKRINQANHLWFPHESGTNEEIIAKYERRFERLYHDVLTKQTVFVICSRSVGIPQSMFDENIMNILLGYNPNNKIIFVCGQDHPYLSEEKYKNRVLFKYLVYDYTVSLDTYDPIFRKQAHEYLDSFNHKFFEELTI